MFCSWQQHLLTFLLVYFPILTAFLKSSRRTSLLHDPTPLEEQHQQRYNCLVPTEKNESSDWELPEYVCWFLHATERRHI